METGLLINSNSRAKPPKEATMLYTVTLIFTVILLLAALSSYAAESEVHNLLLVAIIAVLIRGIQAASATDRT